MILTNELLLENLDLDTEMEDDINDVAVGLVSGDGHNASFDVEVLNNEEFFDSFGEEAWAKPYRQYDIHFKIIGLGWNVYVKGWESYDSSYNVNDGEMNIYVIK